MLVSAMVLLTLNTSKLMYIRVRSRIGTILLSRASARYDGGVRRLPTGQNGTRLLRPLPERLVVLYIPGTGTSVRRTVAVTGRPLPIVLMAESCQLFSRRLRAGLPLRTGVGAQTKLY